MRFSAFGLFFGIGMIFLAACGEKPADQKKLTNFSQAEAKAKYKTLIDSLESLAFKASDKKLNTVLGFSLAKTYTEFADHYPQDTLAPEYLFKAGEVNSGLNASLPAVQCFDRLVKNYPTSKRVPMALFLMAFVSETQLQDTASARKTYLEVIQKYPQTTLARDAQVCVQQLGMSPEELIQKFEKDAQNQASSK
jgi:TolA-binding protein